MRRLIIAFLLTGCEFAFGGEYFCYSTADSAKEAGRGKYPVIQANGKPGQTLYAVEPVVVIVDGKEMWGVPATDEIKDALKDAVAVEGKLKPAEGEPKPAAEGK